MDQTGEERCGIATQRDGPVATFLYYQRRQAKGSNQLAVLLEVWPLQRPGAGWVALSGVESQGHD